MWQTRVAGVFFGAAENDESDSVRLRARTSTGFKQSDSSLASSSSAPSSMRVISLMFTCSLNRSKLWQSTLFVCSGENDWVYLWRAASIYNLVRVFISRRGKQRHAPRVLEDHCVNGPRAARAGVALFKYRHQLLNTST